MKPDDERWIEDHQQTAHKLEVMRRYWATWAAIIAQSGKRPRPFRHEHMWLVDACAGAGMHLSEEHPDGVVLGTALRACYSALAIQRDHAECNVHVRLIEIDTKVCDRLRQRITQFTQAPAHPERVDVQVFEDDFANRVGQILAETEPTTSQYRSLWLFDPYGVVEIPHVAIEPLCVPKYGPEVIVNLDVGGLFRLGCAAESSNGTELLRNMTDGQRERLALTFGGDTWQPALKAFPRKNALDGLAEAYADTFPAFRHRRTHRLVASANQVRYLVHLAHSPKAVESFEKNFKTSLKTGLLSGQKMTGTERSKAARSLWTVFRGKALSLDEMYESGVASSLNRNQLRNVVGTACEDGYGEFDRPKETMLWYETRAKTPTLNLNLKEG